LVGEDALPAYLIESRDTEPVDLLLAADAQLLLGLDLDRQPVRVPAGDAPGVLAAQGVVPADQGLDGAADDVLDAGPGGRRRRALIEDQLFGARALLLRLLEQPLAAPAREDSLLEGDRRCRILGVSHTC